MPVVYGGAAAQAVPVEHFRRAYERGAVVTLVRQPPRAVADQLGRLANLPQGWDSYGGSAISTAVVEKAYDVLTQLYRSAETRGMQIPGPRVQAGSDGSVGLHWLSADRAADLEVFIDLQSVSFIASREGEIAAEGAASSGDDLLMQLGSYILGAGEWRIR